MQTFRLGYTRDFLNAVGEIAMGDIGLDALEGAPAVTVEFMAEYLPEVSAEQASRYDAIISGSPRYTPRTFAGPGVPLSVIARMGVGYDVVDVEALTAHDVILTITPDGVRGPWRGPSSRSCWRLPTSFCPRIGRCGKGSGRNGPTSKPPAWWEEPWARWGWATLGWRSCACSSPSRWLTWDAIPL